MWTATTWNESRHATLFCSEQCRVQDDLGKVVLEPLRISRTSRMSQASVSRKHMDALHDLRRRPSKALPPIITQTRKLATLHTPRLSDSCALRDHQDPVKEAVWGTASIRAARHPSAGPVLRHAQTACYLKRKSLLPGLQRCSSSPSLTRPCSDLMNRRFGSFSLAQSGVSRCEPRTRSK